MTGPDTVDGTGDAGLPTPWTPVALRPEMTAGEASRATFRSLLAGIRANLDGALADRDPEFLHDVRVAVRRTRSGIRAFGGVDPPERLARFATGFRWVQQASGPARDLDVQLLSFRTAPPAALVPLRDLLIVKREAARWTLHNALTSSRFQDLLRGWDRFLARRADGPEAHRPMQPVAAERIARAYRRLTHPARRIRPDSPAERLHEVRKRGKELRYVLEFFSALYPAPLVKRLIRELKSLQDNLGGFQDHEVQAAHLREWGAELSLAGADPATMLAVGDLIVAHEAGSAAARGEFRERFTAFDRAGNRRRFAKLSGGS